jgi:hypothetical protein
LNPPDDAGTIRGIVALPDKLRSVRPYAFGLLIGAGAIVAAWIAFGGSQDSVSADPGIPPPEYVYLDNGHVLAYLSQIEGGLSASEKVSEQVSRERSGGISASGVQVGGSVSQQQFVERVVTPTATTRFYRLLDRLGAKSYLHTVDVADGLPEVARKLRDVPEGDFVRVRNCRFVIPNYAQLALDVRQAHGHWSPSNGPNTPSATALFHAEQAAHPPPKGQPIKDMPLAILQHKLPSAQVRTAAERFAAAVRANPRVPAASCSGDDAAKPGGLDFLFPFQLGALNDDPSVLAGPVTIVGKMLRSVRREGDAYVDDRSLATWLAPTEAMDATFMRDLGPSAYDAVNARTMSSELQTDVSVLAPGVVILPIAIYK